MRRSQLEINVDILKVLSQKGPLKLTHIMYKANVNCSILKEQINFLIKQGLIEEHIAKKNHVVFAVTQKGMTVLKYFRELNSALLIVETAKSQRTPQPFLY